MEVNIESLSIASEESLVLKDFIIDSMLRIPGLTRETIVKVWLPDS